MSRCADPQSVAVGVGDLEVTSPRHVVDLIDTKCAGGNIDVVDEDGAPPQADLTASAPPTEAATRSVPLYVHRWPLAVGRWPLVGWSVPVPVLDPRTYGWVGLMN
jgi:hypothetical protein